MVITIGGTFGSGGKIVAERAAALLGYKLCSDEVVNATIKDLDIDLEERAFRYFDESQGRASLTDLKGTANQQHKSNYTALYSDLTKDVVPLDQRMANAQEQVIKKLADENNCVLLGRCADYYLRGRTDVISVFCVDEMENRVELIHDYYKVNLKQARKIITKADKRRHDYYAFFTGESWGDLENYDLVLHTSTIGLDVSAQLLKSLVELKEAAEAQE